MGGELEISLGWVEGVPEVRLLEIGGSLTHENIAKLLSSFEGLQDPPVKYLVVDFTGTRYINSTGITTIVSLISQVQDNKGKIAFCGLSLDLVRVMEIVGLVPHIPIFNRRRDAALAIQGDG